MPAKITLYVDEELHHRLKAAASLRGQSLSEFMVEAALRLLQGSNRRQAAEEMDKLRSQIHGTFASDELRKMREEGRL
jgi:fatty acid-binding protein DegV